MEGLDELFARWSEGSILLVGLTAALLLGVRHATDPDHLVAVSTLVAGEDERAGRTAARLGALWGIGHAVTVVLLGLPIALAGTDVRTHEARSASTSTGTSSSARRGRPGGVAGPTWTFPARARRSDSSSEHR